MLAIQTQLHNLHSVGMKATPLEQCLQSAQIIKFHHGKERAYNVSIMVHEPVKKNSVLEHVRSWIQRDYKSERDKEGDN